MPQPNLLIVHTDQQPWWTVSAYGRSPVETPNQDRLAREGALLRNFFTNSAVCTPSRGCFLTGRYPHSHGAYTNNLCLNPDEVTLAEVLRRAGYATSYVGKWHLDGTPRPGWVHPDRAMGFEDARFMFNRGHWQKIEDMPMGDVQPVVHPYGVIGDEHTYTTDYLTDKTLEVLKAARRPFFHMVSYPDPHDPADIREPYHSMFDPDDMPLPSTLHQEDLPDWAGFGGFGTRSWNGSEESLRRRMALFCGEVRCIDDSLGRILAWLEEAGILDETIVVFTSDHGDYMGEHGMTGKNAVYEPVYRVPMLVRWPAAVPAGLALDDVVSTVDFQPTLLRLMGLEPCGREQGHDASALLRGERCDWTDEAHQHHNTHRLAGIFTREWHLAYVQGGQPVLFDRVADPDQVTNRFRDPECAGVVRELTDRILRHHREVGSPACEWLEGLSGRMSVF